MTTEQEREFWMSMRYGLLKQIEAIEKTHFPDKWREREEFKRWLEEKRRKT